MPVKSLADLQGKRIFTFPTAGRFLTQFGVVPVTLPWEDVEVAMQTGELDGIWWCGATEIHSVGWSNVTDALPDQQHQRRLDRLLLRQLRALGRGAGPSEDAVPALDGQLELLPPALVLVGRGALPHQRQARADLDPGRGMGDGPGRGDDLLGRDRHRAASGRPRWCRSSRTTPPSWKRPARPTATPDRAIARPLRLPSGQARSRTVNLRVEPAQQVHALCMRCA